MAQDSDSGTGDVPARLRDLLETGRRGIEQLARAALPTRLQAVLEDIGALPADAEAPVPAARTDRGLPPVDPAHRFDLGRKPDRSLPEHIPWGYDQDRVTAIVVDPDTLYVYWEATDAAIARARDGLGPGGPGAWLNVRVYDVSGRLFDGTNAHSYFDHRIERSDRQWFFTIGKPTSTAVVEVGLKSDEGYFVRTARSGRADFPRREPAPPGAVEWLTVRTAHGAVPEPVAGAPAAAPLRWEHEVNGAGGHETGVAPEERFLPGEAFERQWEWREAFHSEWFEGGRVLVWRGPALRTTWEAGPFGYAVESPAYVEERWTRGEVTVTRSDGRTRVVYGPWHVVVRGTGAGTAQRVLATWEMHCSWDVVEVRERGPAVVTARVPGASELWLGASEWRRGSASEMRLGGASEVGWLGASERLGASELLYGGASAQWMAGASERRLGASEGRLGGSEQWGGGASEHTVALWTTTAAPASPYNKTGAAGDGSGRGR